MAKSGSVFRYTSTSLCKPNFILSLNFSKSSKQIIVHWWSINIRVIEYEWVNGGNLLIFRLYRSYGLVLCIHKLHKHLAKLGTIDPISNNKHEKKKKFFSKKEKSNSLQSSRPKYFDFRSGIYISRRSSHTFLGHITAYFYRWHRQDQPKTIEAH